MPQRTELYIYIGDIYIHTVLQCENATCTCILFCSESYPSLFWQCHNFNSYFFSPVRINISDCQAHSKFQDSLWKKDILSTPTCCLFLSMKSFTKLLKISYHKFWVSENNITSCFASITTLVPNTNEWNISWILMKNGPCANQHMQVTRATTKPQLKCKE